MRERRPEKYKQQMLGAWLNKAEGVIFDNWTIGEFKRKGVSVWGQDYGFAADPTTLIETNIDTSTKTIYLRECVYLPRLTTSKIAELNLKHARDGLIVDQGKWRGTGVNNLTDKISTNRIGIPASVQEWWDYEDIGRIDKAFDEPGLSNGKLYKVHTETGKIYVTGTENPPIPCCAYPITYGPIEITKEELLEASEHPNWCSSGYDLNRL